jgi:hypothetical protein
MHSIVLSDEDLSFINEAASILMLHYKAVTFLGNINGQAAKSAQDQKDRQKEQFDAAVEAAAAVDKL